MNGFASPIDTNNFKNIDIISEMNITQACLDTELHRRDQCPLALHKR
jgi:hypothetical protein